VEVSAGGGGVSAVLAQLAVLQAALHEVGAIHVSAVGEQPPCAGPDTTVKMSQIFFILFV
jgi:hypothetical protein